MIEPKRKAKVGVNRSEVFAFRMDPRMKYLSELAARRQRRSLANFIECAVETALQETRVGDGESLLFQGKKLWDLYPSDRLLNLAEHYPDLLTYDEQLIVRVIQDHLYFSKKKKKISFWNTDGEIDRAMVRALWAEITEYAAGGTSENLNQAMIEWDEEP